MSGSKREHPGPNGGVKAKRKAETAIVPIYARLPKGPHGLGATGVARNQRLRMHGGMIEAVATRGYRQTSVRHVIGLAGVSRRAFYEHFSGKEDCFMATFDLIVKRAIQRLTQTCRAAEGSPERRMRMALEALGEEIEQNPKALRLVMIDAQTTGPRGLERLHRMTALCEGRLASVLSSHRRPIPDRSDALPQPVVRAIVGGLRRVTYIHLRDRETGDLQTLIGEMSKWSLLFSSPAAVQLRPQPCTDLPSPTPNPPSPTPATLELDACGGQSSRGRLLRSAIELRVQEEKLDELSSLRIADGAKLPIEAFMELFSGPEECYLEALDVLGDELLQLVADPGLVSAEWPAAVCRTVARLLAYLASSPVRLRTLAVKALEAGPSAIANVGDLLYEVATLLTEGAPRRPCTGIAVEAIAGALWQILNCEALAGRGHRLPVLSEYVSYVVLTPYIGPEEAAAAIASSREAPARPAEARAEEARPAGADNGAPAANGAAPRGTPAGGGAAANGGAATRNGSAPPGLRPTRATGAWRTAARRSA